VADGILALSRKTVLVEALLGAPANADFLFMDIETLEQFSKEKLEHIASDWDGSSEKFFHEGGLYDSVVAENAIYLLENSPE